MKTGDTAGFRVIDVPAGRPALIRNVGTKSAYVLNLPSAAWTAQDPDERPVTGWNYGANK